MVLEQHHILLSQQDFLYKYRLFKFNILCVFSEAEKSQFVSDLLEAA